MRLRGNYPAQESSKPREKSNLEKGKPGFAPGLEYVSSLLEGDPTS
jgi:hypothetical protein